MTEMPVLKIRYIGLLRNSLGKSEETVELPDGTTVRDLLDVLGEKYGNDFRATVLTSDGKLKPTTTLLLDGTDIEGTGGLESSLVSREQLTILALVHPPAGG
jgi:molybdopterin synthase sulfur carrier subunit